VLCRLERNTHLILKETIDLQCLITWFKSDTFNINFTFIICTLFSLTRPMFRPWQYTHYFSWGGNVTCQNIGSIKSLVCKLQLNLFNILTVCESTSRMFTNESYIWMPKWRNLTHNNLVLTYEYCDSINLDGNFPVLM
jgi:hypothetical protein